MRKPARAVVFCCAFGILMGATSLPAAARGGPLISDIRAFGITAASAKITWSLDRYATGRVRYGTTTSYGRTTTLEASFDFRTHVQRLAGLRPGTRYHYRVVSVDRQGHKSVSADRAFTTDGTNNNTSTSGSISVPASIDPTGSRNASAALQTFLNGVPDGSTIVFKAGGVYRMDHGLRVRNRHDLVFDGNGATFKANWATIDKSTPVDSLIAMLGNNRHIVIRDFHFDGSDPNPGAYRGSTEHNHAIMVQGDDVDIHDVTVRRMGGDAFHLHDWSDGVHIHDSHVYSVGRNGVCVIAAQNVVVERVAFDVSGYVTLDIEPNTSDQGARNVVFRDNTAGTWGDSFFSALGASGSVVDGVTVTRNTVTGRSLKTHVYLASGRRDITFTNNTSQVKVPGSVLIFAHIDGLTITGNHQPLSSGHLASIRDSTHVVYRP